MVIDDFGDLIKNESDDRPSRHSSQNSIQKSNQRSSEGKQSGKNRDVKVDLALAQPFDRLAAVVADSILFFPMASLVLAFFKKEMVLIQMTGTEPQLHAYLLFYSFLFLVLAWSYQVFFLIVLGATPGKFFFGLRVWDIWLRKKLSWSQALLRSFFWWVDCATVLPMLALFFDSHRRPFHDRMSDTVVINIRGRATGVPTVIESFLAKSFLVLFIFTSTTFASWSLWENYGKALEQKVRIKQWVG